MKIVDVCAFYAPRGGGVKTYIEHKLREGPARGHEIVIIAPGEEDRIEQYGPLARIVWRLTESTCSVESTLASLRHSRRRYQISGRATASTP